MYVKVSCRYFFRVSYLIVFVCICRYQLGWVGILWPSLFHCVGRLCTLKVVGMHRYLFVWVSIVQYVFVSIGITGLSAGIIGISFPYCKDTTTIHSKHSLPTWTPSDPTHSPSFHCTYPFMPLVPDPPPTQFSCHTWCQDLSCHSYKLGQDAPEMSEHGSKPVLGPFCLNVLHQLKTEIYSWNYDASNMVSWLFRVYGPVLTPA